MSKQSDLVTVARDAGASGYVNVTGDTMTGALTVPQAGGSLKIVNNGTAGNNANIFFGIPNQTDGWSIGQGITANDGVFRIYDNGAGQARMAVDASGRVTMPYQPAFKATSTNNNTAVPASGDGAVLSTRFDKVTDRNNHNVGGHYNTSTGRFTAPVAGVYFIYANMRWETGSFVQNSYIRLFVAVNGESAAYFNGIHQINGLNEAWANYMAMSISGTLLLSAGDYVDLRGGMNGGTAVGYWSESSFGGYLLG